jgi:fumarate reductase subunit D
MSNNPLRIQARAHWWPRLKLLANRSDTFAAWLVPVVLAEILTVGTLKAFYKPFWLDEIMGVLIAKLPRSSDIWEVCKSGADNQPALYHYAMRASLRLFGNDALGMRMPSLLGYIFFCFCVYWFVSRRSSPLYGLVAMLFPSLTASWYYATEGRPYALLLACAGLGVVSWQSIVMQRRRGLMLGALALSLLCALNLHYYAVLLVIPFAIAESVRTYCRRKLDPAVWVALLAPLMVLLIYVPVLQASRVNSGIPTAYFAKASLSESLWTFAQEFLGRSIVALVCLAGLYFSVQIFRTQSEGEYVGHTLRRAEFIPEASLVLGFTCFPVFAVALSRFGTHIFFTRYAIAGVLGLAALIGLAASLAFINRKAPGLALACIFIVLVVHDQRQYDLPLISIMRDAPASVRTEQRIPETVTKDELPIAVTNPDDFMQFVYYGSPNLQKRVVYVSSEVSALHYLGYTFHERMMIGSAPYFGTQVIDYATFIHAHQSFYVLGPLLPAEWMVPKLLDDHAELRLLQGGPGDTTCFRATVTD